MSPRASTLSSLNHYTVSVLQLEAKVLWVVFQSLITATAPITSHKLEFFVRFIPRNVSSSRRLRIRHSRKCVSHPRTHTRCSRNTLDTSRLHLQKKSEIGKSKELTWIYQDTMFPHCSRREPAISRSLYSASFHRLPLLRLGADPSSFCRCRYRDNE